MNLGKVILVDTHSCKNAYCFLFPKHFTVYNLIDNNLQGIDWGVSVIFRFDDQGWENLENPTSFSQLLGRPKPEV